MKFFKIYKNTSPYLIKLRKYIRQIFLVIRDSDIETIKKHLQFVLLGLAIDYLISATILNHYLSLDIKLYLWIGLLLFLTAAYFIIPKAIFEGIRLKTNENNWVLIPSTILFASITYIYPSLIKTQGEVSLAYPFQHLKVEIIEYTYAILSVLTFASAALLIINLAFKYLMSINFYVSSWLCGSMKRFSNHCLLLSPEEPHEIPEAWYDLIMCIVTWAILVISIIK